MTNRASHEARSVGQHLSQLTLKIPSREIFDTMIIAPHSEVNNSIFEHVDRFSRRDRSRGPMTVCVYTDRSSPVMQEKFREAFREHYEDDLKEARRSIRLRYLQAIIFIALTWVIILLWDHLRGRLLLNVLQNIWAFSLWKIGDTFISGIQEFNNYRRLLRIRDAQISFFITRANRSGGAKTE